MERVVERRSSGVTLIELAVVLAIVGFLSAVAVPTFNSMFGDQRLKSAARAVADAFFLARAESIRTGRTHLVVFQQALGATEPIVIIDDGLPANSNCTIDAGEVRHSIAAVEGVVWGTTSTLANGTPAPNDQGAASGDVATGSSFTDASRNPINGVTWVLFQPDGIPRLFTSTGAGNCNAVGQAGLGGGSIYLTNTRRDYAIVLSNVGSTRTHVWVPSAGGWKN